MAVRALAVRALTAIATTFTGRLAASALAARALAARTLASTRLTRLTFRLDVDFRHETFHFDTLELALEQTFDTAELLALIAGNQRDGTPAGTGATGTSDPVNVVFRDIGQFVVHDLRQLLDIQATCRDIGGNQHAHFAVLETGQCLGTGILALVAMNRRGADAGLLELGRQTIGPMLGTREDQHLMPVFLEDQMLEQRRLVALLHGMDMLLDLLGRGVARAGFHGDRIIEQLVGHAANLVREGRGEQQRLPLGRQQLEQAADVVDEAHVQHAVRFVQHQRLEIREIDGLLGVQVQQATRCGGQDLDAGRQAADLRIDLHATEHHGIAQLQVTGVGSDVLVDLRGQFTRRRDDQGLDLAGACRGAV